MTRRQITYAASALLAIAISGCAATQTWDGDPFPTTPVAAQHYEAATQHLAMRRYELAAEEFSRSIELEPTALIPHVRLGLARFGEGQFREAAASFQYACEEVGGPGTYQGGPFCVLQATALMRGNEVDQQQARQLLEEWSASNVMMVGSTAVYSGSGRLPGWWKEMAKYLLGDVSEQDIMDVNHDDVGYFAHLFVGLDNARRGNSVEADSCLREVVRHIGAGTWRCDLAKIELRRIEEAG